MNEARSAVTPSAELIRRLRNVLDLERRKGYADSAVIGGLASFLSAWQGQWPEAERVRARSLVESLAGYNSADTSKEAWRKADGDESLADKIGNAGDDMRRTVDDR